MVAVIPQGSPEVREHKLLNHIEGLLRHCCAQSKLQHTAQFLDWIQKQDQRMDVRMSAMGTKVKASNKGVTSNRHEGKGQGRA